MSYYNCDPPPIKERLIQKIKPEIQDQDLRKCLNVVDLIIQGLAHIVGGGIFIITPGVLAAVTGPALVFSYMISAFVLFFTVVCYMDLGSRYSGIGNAYVYVYASLGELGAGFVWVFMTIELCLSEALIAVGFGKNFDLFLLNGTFDRLEMGAFSAVLPDMFAGHVNTIAIGLLVVSCIINCIGIKQVLWVNTVVVGYALFVLSLYFVISLIYGDIDTFANSTDPATGKGGVFPYGYSGMFRGAAIVIISFCGFETIVTLSAESKQPKRDVPIATFTSYSIAVMFYIITAFAIAYLVPWYTIKEHKTTGIPFTLQYHNLTIPSYFAIAGLLLATMSVVLCKLTTISRSIFKVACDGLFFKVFADVMECSKVPVLATIASTIFTIVITLVFSYDDLIQLVSGGALLVFVIINYSLVVITYTKPVKDIDENTNLVSSEEDDNIEPPIDRQEWKVALSMALFTLLIFVACFLAHLPKGWSFWAIRFPIIVIMILKAVAILIYIRYTYILQTNKDQTFICPLVPFIPGLGMFLNVFLYSFLSSTAHYMSFTYIIAGAIIYFSYGYFNSNVTVAKQKLWREQELEEPNSENMTISS